MSEQDPDPFFFPQNACEDRSSTKIIRIRNTGYRDGPDTQPLKYPAWYEM